MGGGKDGSTFKFPFPVPKWVNRLTCCAFFSFWLISGLASSRKLRKTRFSILFAHIDLHAIYSTVLSGTSNSSNFGVNRRFWDRQNYIPLYRSQSRKMSDSLNVSWLVDCLIVRFVDWMTNFTGILQREYSRFTHAINNEVMGLYRSLYDWNSITSW